MPCMRVTVIPFYVKRKGRKVYKFLIKWTEPKFWFGALRWKVENSDLAHFSEETTKVKKEGRESFQISNKMNCCSHFINVKRLKVLIYVVIFVQVSRVAIIGALRWKVKNSDLALFFEETTNVKKVIWKGQLE